MNLYKAYLEEIEKRKSQALKPKPIDNGPMVEQLISQIIDNESPYRKESLDFFIYNIIPGTTSAALVKAKFLKQIILGEIIVNEISSAFALELLSHMNGGPSVDVLLDLALGSDIKTAQGSAEILKTKYFYMKLTLTGLNSRIKKEISLLRIFLKVIPKLSFIQTFQI